MRHVPHFELLEPRRVLAAPSCFATDCLEIPLDPEADLFGRQIPVIQAFRDELETRATFAIFDTGASVISFSALDRQLAELLETPFPVRVAGGAEAVAVGGTIRGDVSQPGEVLVDGLHSLDFGSDLLPAIEFDGAAIAERVQAFLGSSETSPLLPSLAGTPIHNPSARHPDGVASQIDLNGYTLNLGPLFPELPEFADVVVELPDLQFVPPGSGLSGSGPSFGELGISGEPVRIALSLLGTSNHLAPGESLTTSPVPVQTGVDLYMGELEAVERTLLFDTGAQLSVISPQLAESLGLDLSAPQRTIEVQGAGGTLQVPGFTLDVLDLPTDADADGTEDGRLRFTQVPVFVLETLSGLDGILGMNLLNHASDLLYDPWDPAGPSLQLVFDGQSSAPLDPQAAAGLNLIAATYPAFAGTLSGQVAPGFQADFGPEWQNPVNRLDVDNNGSVAPADVLRLFNLLDSQGAHRLPDPAIRASNSPVFFDVNGDGAVAPSDPLLVINYLNANLGSLQGAEGEGPAVVVPPAELRFTGSSGAQGTIGRQDPGERTETSRVSSLSAAGQAYLARPNAGQYPAAGTALAAVSLSNAAAGGLARQDDPGEVAAERVDALFASFEA